MKRLTCCVLAGAALLAACGSSDDSADDAVVETSAEAADTAPATEAPTTEPATTEPPATEAPVTEAPTTEAPTTEAVETTAAPDATEAPADGDATATDLTAEEQAAADAWAIVFDSNAEFDAKRAHLADAAALQATLDAYTAAGTGFGGISLEPTAVVVAGDTAEIVYDVNFGENPAYTDQTGSIGLVDGVWVVDREQFCSFMSSARVGCP